MPLLQQFAAGGGAWDARDRWVTADWLAVGFGDGRRVCGALLSMLCWYSDVTRAQDCWALTFDHIDTPQLRRRCLPSIALSVCLSVYLSVSVSLSTSCSYHLGRFCCTVRRRRTQQWHTEYYMNIYHFVALYVAYTCSLSRRSQPTISNHPDIIFPPVQSLWIFIEHVSSRFRAVGRAY